MHALVLAVAAAALDAKLSVIVDGGAGVHHDDHHRADHMRQDPVPATAGACAVTSAFEFSKVGCGKCALGCNEYAPETLSGHMYEPPTGGFSEAACVAYCRGQETCKGVTIDHAERTCHIHDDLPYMQGALCNGKCGNTDCGDQVCLARTSSSSGSMRIVEVGHGACGFYVAPGEEVSVLKTQPYPAGLAQDNCRADCEADKACRSYSVGVRTCLGTVGASVLPDEHVCQLYGTTASQVVQDTNRLTEHLCSEFCTDGAGACVIPPADMRCFAKSHLAVEAPEMILRSDGICLSNSWKEATVFHQLTLEDSQTNPQRHCQEQCELLSNSNPPCKGVSFALSANSSEPSFCRLYSDPVVAGSTKELAEQKCEACAASVYPCPCDGHVLDGCPACDSDYHKDQGCCKCRECASLFDSRCFAYGAA